MSEWCISVCACCVSEWVGEWCMYVYVIVCVYICVSGRDEWCVCACVCVWSLCVHVVSVSLSE